MKAGFFIQLALAIMFGLVAGLPQCKLTSLFCRKDSYILN